MKRLIQITLYAMALFLGNNVFAQPIPPYYLTFSGQVADCLPNSSVFIETMESNQTNTQVEVPLDSNCAYSVQVEVQTLSPTIVVFTQCSGPNYADTLNIQVDPLFPDSTLTVDLDCSGNVVIDCEGNENGPAMPGTACTTLGGQPGIYSTNCSCEEILTCNSCFTLEQVTNGSGIVPFTISTTNCTSGGVAPYTYLYSFGDGETSTGEDAVHDYSIAGDYLVCLTITDASGCTNTECDSIVVDANGTINPMSNTIDCLGIVNGQNTPGTPCDLGMNEVGTWDNNCVCQPDTITNSCQAGFWLLQAYQNVDSTGGNPGGVEPIPNEVWVWNTSTGSGSYQFVWDFGDGATSTEPFPTHIYATGGPYVLCLTMMDNANCTSSYCDTLSIDTDGLFEGMIIDDNDHGHTNNSERSGFTLNVLQQVPTSIEEQPSLNELTLWPNPVSEALTLSLVSSHTSKLELSILDLNGRIVTMTTNGIYSGNNRVTLPVSELESGMYIIRISDGITTVSRHFVKQ